MKKTLLLVFIHGFKGGEDTFGTFPEHLRALISHALPKVDVVALTYPKFETRGDLKECVGRFREWLQDRVIDIEVAHHTPSPTIDPSVHTVLIGHSMGGIVAADTLLLLTSDQPLPHPSPSNSTADVKGKKTKSEDNDNSSSLIFPHVQGILAFDTPYLGIAPGVVAHGAEDHYRTASTAYSTISEVAGAFGWGSKSEPDIKTSNKSAPPPLPPAAGDAAAVPSWQRWGRYAMFAGGAAVAATGAAALYSQRDRFTAGWGWVTSHLEFVGCLARGEELKQRLRSVEKEAKQRGLGFADFYTVLGKGKRSEDTSVVKNVLATKDRTFCALPDKNVGLDGTMKWHKALNDKARFETGAHMSMFVAKDNPGFFQLSTQARDVLVSWVDQGWYQSSEGRSTGGIQIEEESAVGGEPVNVPDGGEDEEIVVVN